MTIAEHIIKFYASLKAPRNLPEGVEVLHPQQDEQAMEVVKTFYGKYYSDHHPRQLLFGINPGRFGAGTTGVNFTGPKQLTEYCGIQHPFKPRSELSAEFIYEMITAYGGPEKFYKKFFITSVSPLGFIKNGVNLNYYDDAALAASLRPWIVQTIREQLSFTHASGPASALEVKRTTVSSIPSTRNLTSSTVYYRCPTRGLLCNTAGNKKSNTYRSI